VVVWTAGAAIQTKRLIKANAPREAGPIVLIHSSQNRTEFLRIRLQNSPLHLDRGLAPGGYSDLTFSLPGLDQGDVPLLLAVLSEKQCKVTLVQALLKD
jgi:hypothetical protein